MSGGCGETRWATPERTLADDEEEIGGSLPLVGKVPPSSKRLLLRKSFSRLYSFVISEVLKRYEDWSGFMSWYCPWPGSPLQFQPPEIDTMLGQSHV